MCNSCPESDVSLSRRRLMLGGAALLAANTLSFARVRAEQPKLSTPAPNAIPPDEALKRLMDGNARYVANASEEKDYSVGRSARVSAQYPIAAVLSCSDSRVVPELAFDQGPGDVFVVRVAGNVLNVDGLASMEYAVKFLGAPLLMVLGHTNCGAVDAAVKVVKDRAELPGHLPTLVKAIEPAVIAAHGRHPSDLLAAAIDENVKLNAKRLAEDAPIVTAAEASRKIKVVGGVYDLATGKVRLL
jgi:carbonic anhydrase